MDGFIEYYRNNSKIVTPFKYIYQEYVKWCKKNNIEPKYNTVMAKHLYKIEGVTCMRDRRSTFVIINKIDINDDKYKNGKMDNKKSDDK